MKSLIKTILVNVFAASRFKHRTFSNGQKFGFRGKNLDLWVKITNSKYDAHYST